MIVTTTDWSLVLANGVRFQFASTCLDIAVGFNVLNLTQRLVPVLRSGCPLYKCGMWSSCIDPTLFVYA